MVYITGLAEFVIIVLFKRLSSRVSLNEHIISFVFFANRAYTVSNFVTVLDIVERQTPP